MFWCRIDSDLRNEPEIYDGNAGFKIATVDGICCDVPSLLQFQFVK
jgi:hypothetical protein